MTIPFGGTRAVWAVRSGSPPVAALKDGSRETATSYPQAPGTAPQASSGEKTTDAPSLGAFWAGRGWVRVKVPTGLHVCRGNYRSRWVCEGSLEPVAERMFGELPYDAFLVEWDDVRREGGYEAIRFVPPGHVVVMGLVSSKRAELEHEEDVVRRLDEAARHLPLEQLALSTQCGFASVIEGNELDEETQWRKLALVALVADRVWG